MADVQEKAECSFGRNSHPKFDCLRFLPVVFVIMIVGILYSVYVFGHCLNLMQIDIAKASRDREMETKGLVELVVFNVITFLMVVSYLRSFISDPGRIPDTPEWKVDAVDKGSDPQSVPLLETKRTGERRQCKWCNLYKPDRSHHCRTCQRCVLKMDHHCPWIYNCVGFQNHKFFFLLVIYGTLASHMISWTMFESVKRSVEQDKDALSLFSLIFGETIAIFVSLALTPFLFFHCYLLCRGLSTIEWCEKTWPGANGAPASTWNQGIGKNFVQVFGPYPWLWLIPVNYGRGDGVHFLNENTKLTAAMEHGRDTGEDTKDSLSARLAQYGSEAMSNSSSSSETKRTQTKRLEV